MAQYPDVRSAEINPLVHYLVSGKNEGRFPSAFAAAAFATISRGGVELHNDDSSKSNLHADDGQTQARARRASDIDLLVSSELFDPVWYVQNHPEAMGQNPYSHFLLNGGPLGLKASVDFDCESYLRTYPDVAASGMNPLIHYLRYGIQEGRNPGLSAGQRWSIKQTILDAKSLDPEFEAAHDFFAQDVSGLPLNTSIPVTRAAIAWQAMFADLPPQIEHIVFAPWLVRGGADLACANIVRAAQEVSSEDKVLLVVTDHERLDALEWLPNGTRLLVFSDYDATLNNDERTQIVESLIFALRPVSVCNVNSLAMWDAIAKKGLALRSVTRIFAALFCRDFTLDGRGAGYSDTHFRACVENIEAIYFDTHSFIAEMNERYGLTAGLQAKLAFLAQPVLQAINVSESVDGRSVPHMPRVLWAGRFCHQKNPELLARIARRLPGVSFDVWGSGDSELEDLMRNLAKEVPSVRLCGTFRSFSDLPLSTYSAFLFTSRFEGMPTVLINAAAANLPIVASSVGGVSELVTNETGWPIEEIENEAQYCNALNEVLENSNLVATRLFHMRKLIQTQRSWDSFVSALTLPGGFLERRNLT
ncbi:glycosyltransferase [Variovorax dokdonensis]|uniref:Glycosyltransferase n=1 Tax=Variovorax dokdonensis TaxID=344883 RepID=A0ABT7NB29_9BURK|nr:glycosyltransferase [Variovorax dokdonensis]MDM0045148.1 glycosyltransferase [Variovorax dokdonensis]